MVEKPKQSPKPSVLKLEKFADLTWVINYRTNKRNERTSKTSQKKKQKQKTKNKTKQKKAKKTED